MKSFKKFNEDVALTKPGAGGLLSLAGRIGAQPVVKGIKALTSFASMKDDFVERRKRKKAVKQKANDTIQKTRDPEADKRIAGAAKDPDLKKLDDNPPKWD